MKKILFNLTNQDRVRHLSEQLGVEAIEITKVVAQIVKKRDNTEYKKSS